MKKIRWQVGVLALILGAFAALGQKTTAETLFREALMKERAEGSLREAIFRYERIIADFSSDKQFAAQAMYQLSQIYGKQGDSRAKDMLTRLSRTGIAPYAARAQAALVEQTSAASTEPGPFPEVKLDVNDDLGSPDGRFIVYHKDVWKSGVLYLKELATGTERVLVDGGYVLSPAWSPDSTRLAYRFGSYDEKIREIRIVQISNGQTVNLGVHGLPISWTDSGEIFFYLPNYAADGADYSLLPATGGTPRKVHTGAFSAALTPDGSRLIVQESKKLFAIDLATGRSQAITAFAGSENQAMISPDGRLVAFLANPEGRWALYIAPLDKGLPVKNPLKVKDIDVGDAPASGRQWRKWWTRSGILTFPLGRAERNIYRVDVDPKSGRAVEAPVRLTQDAASNTGPSISPDGKRIAYWYLHRGKSGLAVMDSSGANERLLFEQALWAQAPYWRSPEQIMFLNTKPGEGKKRGVYSLNVNSGGLEPVAETEGLYWHYVPGRNEILQVVGDFPKPATVLKALSLADGKQRVVATVDGLDGSLAISPDGKRIAYMAARRGQSSTGLIYEMALMSINGEPLGRLLSDQQEWLEPDAWSPDGKYLLYTPETGPRVMNVETRESWPLHKEIAPGAGSDWGGSSWSPDGTFILLGKRTQTEERLTWSGVTADAVARLMEDR
jgi:Tol biopolymer transport system component